MLQVSQTGEAPEKIQAKPWPVAQLVRGLSLHTKVSGLIPHRGTYKIQPINHKQAEQQINVSLFLSPHPLLSFSEIIQPI